MGIRSKLKTARSLSWRDRGMVVEAAVTLSVARITLLLIPYRRFRPWLTLARPGVAEPGLVSRVRLAVAIAARNLPFQVVCLPQAMAAKAMLARRGAASSMWIGVGRDGSGAMILHAWLEAGDTIVTGAAGKRGITEITRFG